MLIVVLTNKNNSMNGIHRKMFESPKTLALIYLDQILAFDSRCLKNWANEKLSKTKLFYKKNEKDTIIKTLEQLVVERKKLDIFLSIGDSYNNKTNRMDIFKRICLLSRDHFMKELENNMSPFRLITDEEIILEIFVKYTMQHNPYYNKVKVSNIIKKSKHLYGKQSNSEFIIKWKDASNITCYSGKRQLPCFQGKLAIFFAITYFIWHMKEFHFNLFKSDQRKNELYILLKSFDINK